MTGPWIDVLPERDTDTNNAAHDASLVHIYEAHLERHGWQADDAQREAVGALDQLRRQLLASEAHTRNRRWWPFRSSRVVPRGLYLWGGVGRGKTFLMDLFHESLPQVNSHRSHFHRFMYDVHAQLKHLGERRDPLTIVAAELAGRARVLCFDEFFVSDIADAMILGRLMQLLIRNGVVVVATSNVPPDGLYRDGLQRARFLPAIATLERHCRVLNVDAGVDYRLRILDQAAMYYHPCDDNAVAALTHNFDALTDAPGLDGSHMLVEGRPIPVLRKTAGMAWFRFADICEGPRSQNDYIAIAKRLHTVLISDVPQMGNDDDNAARRFIALVDEFYERNVNLMLAAAVSIDQLYTGRKLAFEFERSKSRLAEMQSHDYLSSPHRA